ncbi:iron-containing alcohol dehydrogenase family protein [Bifidobacterium gallicum]|uniref:Alcohol dehydrogenase, iron-dependent n=1 Tax=Bifidobacterium gallicum DSM 20093 = LMG 11596 TaxID=561180 RepID=D1NT83_9BIFI|nr:iron-containing alcohol dehydrogenase family protein [Bifidobacterium gallicum]EFA23885.1 alcohol dehydrogenase, iron-dependent [Bifidobacterium gallicum DSM 20093 = LMG 11596]KFI59131.1 oxidoreductase [Bifidobacterium gallicum DSM 20093 = LMG 11596]
MTSNVKESDVRSGPDRYVSEAGAAKHVPDYLSDYERPLILTGVKSADAFLKYNETDDFFAPALRYDGSASVENAKELVEQAKAYNPDVIVAIGAGKLSDTAKNVAEMMNLPLVIVATLCSSCAAYSACSVNYDAQHRYLGSPMHKSNSMLLLVDPALIAEAPAESMVGGIGDTIAKFYEADPVFEIKKAKEGLTAFDRLSATGSALLRDTLIEVSEPALADMRAGNTKSANVKMLIDTNLGLAGIVGGFGGAAARQSGAHAIHNGLTQLPGSAASMHGEKVAYGVLIQLLVEGKVDEVKRLLPFYDAVGLPHTMEQMGLEYTPDNAAVVAAHATRPESAFYNAVPDLTAERIEQAMANLETIAND